MRLHDLLDPSFHASMAVFSGAKSIYVALQNSDDLKQLTYSYSIGEIGDKEIESFVSGIMSNFVEGNYFSNEIQLLAVAVLLQAKQTDFTKQLLTDFSRIRRKELPLLPKVTEMCIESFDEISEGYTDRRFEKCAIIFAKVDDEICAVFSIEASHESLSYVVHDQRESCGH